MCPTLPYKEHPQSPSTHIVRAVVTTYNGAKHTGIFMGANLILYTFPNMSRVLMTSNGVVAAAAMAPEIDPQSAAS